VQEFSSDTGQLVCNLDDRVFTITLNRPEARNALSDELTRALRRALTWAATSADVGAIVMTGAGKAFCAGGDVKRMASRNASAVDAPGAQAAFLEMSARHHETAGALRLMRKPSIAALPGAAAGAGLALALACDLRIASDTAFVSTGYARVGLSGDYGVAWLLTRTVGPAQARQLMLTAERVAADRAEQIGLFNRIVPEADLRTEAQAWARQLANGPAIALGYIKDSLDEALSIDHASAINNEADRLLKSRSTNDHREAARAFVEKRDPQFTGT
jgi:enoyl-CoA hydratase/carnithine racemase